MLQYDCHQDKHGARGYCLGVAHRDVFLIMITCSYRHPLGLPVR